LKEKIFSVKNLGLDPDSATAWIRIWIRNQLKCLDLESGPGSVEPDPKSWFLSSLVCHFGLPASGSDIRIESGTGSTYQKLTKLFFFMNETFVMCKAVLSVYFTLWIVQDPAWYAPSL
jgi:hypothetical protein